jgi:hypothetical protein
MRRDTLHKRLILSTLKISGIVDRVIDGNPNNVTSNNANGTGYFMNFRALRAGDEVPNSEARAATA